MFNVILTISHSVSTLGSCRHTQQIINKNNVLMMLMHMHCIWFSQYDIFSKLTRVHYLMFTKR